MARIPYAGTEGSPFRRLLLHTPEVSRCYWTMRKALDESTLPPKICMLAFLATDVTNHCRY